MTEAGGAALAGLLILASIGSALAGSDAPAPLPVTEIAPGIYLHQGPHEEATPENLGGFANVGFVVGERAVAVIDPGGSHRHGEALRAALRQVTDLPVAAVITTHAHPDHALGASAFVAEQPNFIGHAKLPASLAARGLYYIERLREPLGALAEGTEVIMPETLVEDRMTLDLGGRSLILTAHPTAHTDHDLSVFDSATNTLWASDLLFVERTPVVDGSLKGWLAVLETLQALPAERVVPGHGPVVADWPQALEPQRRYLGSLLTEIRAAIAEGRSIEQAIESVGRSEAEAWTLFEAYHARNVVTVYTELEWE